MSNGAEFKIRTLPRKDEGRRAEPARATKRRAFPVISKAYLIGGATIVALGLILSLVWPSAPRGHDMSSQQAIHDPMINRLKGYVEDVKLKEEVLRQRQELENLRTKAPGRELDLTETAPEMNRAYGVTLDVENTADRLYHELNDRPTLNVDNLPESRINARLEKNKWVNQLDRQERVQFVRNFIKSAYDRGYEVELDQNLIVVGVRPIANRRVSLDQVIDKISKQGL